jgi:hypothetical protein
MVLILVGQWQCRMWLKWWPRSNPAISSGLIQLQILRQSVTNNLWIIAYLFMCGTKFCPKMNGELIKCTLHLAPIAKWFSTTENIIPLYTQSLLTVKAEHESGSPTGTCISVGNLWVMWLVALNFQLHRFLQIWVANLQTQLPATSTCLNPMAYIASQVPVK